MTEAKPEAKQTPVVRARGVHKRFVETGPWPWSARSEVHALKGVDLTVHRGEVVALVGRSGSGKTTLSRGVLGLMGIDEGEITVEGRDWSGLSGSEAAAQRLACQYIPQDALSALDPSQTVLEHIVETMTVLGGRSAAEAQPAAVALLDRLGLAHRTEALPRRAVRRRAASGDPGPGHGAHAELDRGR